MSTKSGIFLLSTVLTLCLASWGTWRAFHPTVVRIEDETPANAIVVSVPSAHALEDGFSKQVRPFLERYCLTCHGSKNPEAQLDLSTNANFAAVAKNVNQWGHVLERLQAEEMPPEDAPRQPPVDERAAVIAWIRDVRKYEADRHAGDPGPVLARRLSNAELDYTIRDLTGVDIRPTRAFPVDPANEAGFDNTGESLAMSPTLLKKYLDAAQSVAEHLVLKPDGFVFAPYPVLTDTDRDKYCVQRIIDFYDRHKVDVASYFFAAWSYRHRARLGRPAAQLNDFATDAGLSAKYLATIWSVLDGTDDDAGPVAAIRKTWRGLPESADGTRAGCERLRDLVLRCAGSSNPMSTS